MRPKRNSRPGKKQARQYRGRLEAIKLTGDRQRPSRGVHTFIVDDLGEKGYVTTVREEPFVESALSGVGDTLRIRRFLRGKSNAPNWRFKAKTASKDRWIESQLILISHNRLAQYWVGFEHISYFERVNIDDFLIPN